MKKKKILGLFTVSVLGISMLAGCGGNSAAMSNKETKVTEAKEETAADGEVVTIKWIQVGNGMPENYDSWLQQLNPYLEEKIGVNVEMEIVPWGDWDKRRSVIVNSGEKFDILFTDMNRYNSEVNTGAFLDITDLLKEKTPDLYQMVPEDYWKATSIGGKVYAVPTYKDSSSSQYFIWDKAIADKYKIDFEHVTDYEKLYEALKAVKAGEGSAPYYMSKNGAEFLATNFFDQIGAGLVPLGVKYNDETRTVVNPLEDEEVLKELDIIHKMYIEGIINGDAPNADDANKYRTFFTAQGWSGAAKNIWGPQNGIDDCVAVKFGETVVSNTTVRGSLNGISAGCEHPEKALQLLNLVNTDPKVRNWFFYGVEGENFVYEGEKINKLNSNWGMAGYTQGTFFNVGQLVSDEFNQWDEVKELNADAAPSVMLGFDMDTSEVKTEIANCTAVYEKYKAELWTGAREPRELVKTMREELNKAGYEKILATAQAQVNAAK